MKGRLVQLIGGTVALWLLTAYPAYRFQGTATALLLNAVAGGLCLMPTALTFALSRQAAAATPEMQLAAVLGGTGLRMVVVLGGALALYLLVPAFHTAALWGWVLVFYLFTLALEVGLLLADHRSVVAHQDGGQLESDARNHGG